METLRQDLSYGIRTLLRNRVFTVVATLTLALGIGANTAIFSMINGLLIRSLPGVEEPEMLVAVGRTQDGEGFDTFSYPNYIDYRNNNQVFSELSAYRYLPVNIGVEGETERVRGALVTADYFSALGVKPPLGRTFLAEEDRTPGTHPVAVLSYSFWKRRFNSEPDAIGRQILISGQAFTIVGVAPKEFCGTSLIENPIEIWAPLVMYRQVMGVEMDLLNARDAVWMQMFGRLKRGVSIEEARKEMNGLAANLLRDYPKENEGKGIALDQGIGIDPGDRSDIEQLTMLLLAVVGLVLLIACANVANLLLARASTRLKEMGIRLALGAGRGRVIRQLLTESVLLSLLGGAAGMLLAFWLTDLLSSLAPRGVNLSLSTAADWRVVAFTTLLSCLTGLIVGLVPAMHATRFDLSPVLKESCVNLAYRGSFLRSVFVVLQISLSLILLIGAGLFVRTLRNAQSVDLGFKSDNLLTVSIELNKSKYSNDAGRDYYRQLLDRVKSLPGIESASVASTLPFGGSYLGTGLVIEEKEPASDRDWIPIDFNIVGSDYFKTMEIPLVGGRDFNDLDRASAAPVAIINERMAQLYWPGQDPIGKLISRVGENSRNVEIIGVVKEIKYRSLMEKPRPYMYMPFLQKYQPRMVLHASAADPGALLGAVRKEAQAMDKDIPVFGAAVFSEGISNALYEQRMRAALVSLFGFTALLLAALGIYGVISYTVSHRTREIGIRIALGAERSDILALIIGQGIRLTLIGVALGLAGAAALTRVMSSLLYGVSATDPATYVGVSLLLIAAALAACYVPARRAMKIDPMTALRYE